MGNIEAHDFAPVRPDERKELNLSRKPTYKQYLKHLNGEVHEACLREMPYSLRDSICLYETMKAAFNALTELPPELPLRLPHLRYLDLSHNQLDSLPCSFGLFFHLDTLLLQHNRLQALPHTFTRLVKLEKVDLSHNTLRELPEDLGEMERLQRLNVSHNKLRHLPLSLGNSPQLHLLLAEHNRLDSPPQSVCDEGSASTLTYLRKQFQAHRDQNPPRPATPLNEFPRHRSNQPHSPVSNPQSAHLQYIQEQTHTTNTPTRIKTPLMPPLGSSSFDALELRDRIVGLIFGAALGDIVGLSTRWMTPDETVFHYGSAMLDFTRIVQDQHRLPWRQGDWTSNFDIFMLVLDSLINWAGVVDELDFAKRLSAWSERGFPELGDSAGILTSSTISQVVVDKNFTSDPHGTATSVLQQQQQQPSAMRNGTAVVDVSNGGRPRGTWSGGVPASLESTCNTVGPVRVEEPSSCTRFGTDNGAIIRSAVLGIPSFHDLDEVQENSVRICRATHADPCCVASCVFISLLVASLLQGSPQADAADWDRVMEPAKQRALSFLSDPLHREQFIKHLSICSLSQLNVREKGEMSHTFKPLGAVMLALRWEGQTPAPGPGSGAFFSDFLWQLSREGGDSSSNCCVGGAIAGLLTGYRRLPRVWLQGLRAKQLSWLNLRVNHLLDMMGLP
ncbi:uncharacterized protein LOC143285132 [Babylonia areolata]|uniref:uncharacterized protein LOC143285132 n=1 Tax=Babylonia areolata TaxID=304850 RepID=UPI003FD3D6C5